jgi:hypothetical protein
MRAGREQTGPIMRSRSMTQETFTIPGSAERVPLHTAEEFNQRIADDIIARVHYLAAQPDKIDERLSELDQEWDIERSLEANASALALTGLFMSGATGRRRWLALPALVSGFLFQHAVQGWCPPLPILRRLGFRTVHEIERERYALKAVRGDFDDVLAIVGPPEERARKALDAAERPH